MSDYNPQTLEIVRQAVTQVARKDFSTLTATAPLHLDSIARIAVVAELENAFEVELSADDIIPEVFATLGSLARVIDARRG